MDGRDEDAAVPPASEVSCSICLDLVSDTGARSWAKLHCGHQFHLDCIGSAFNMKGAMQCPNCRKVEKGQWLYANGSTRSLPELTMEEWTHEEYYDPVYSEMQQFRAQWCPFGEFTRVGSSPEDVESPLITSAAPRSSNGELDSATRPNSFRHPSPFEHGSSSRAGSSFVSSMFHRYPGSGAHTYDIIWPSLAYHRHQHRFHQQRFNRPGVAAPVVPGVRGMAPMTPAVPQPDQSGGFYVYPQSGSSGQYLPEAESSYPNNYLALEREQLPHFRTVTRVSGWGGYYPTSSSGSGNRSWDRPLDWL
ncbi:E3 ubiquitin-protein ligase RFI2-like isoform X1 [Hibiscus syriacus]|uniref:E3 ubiquitin-protein ligase RFI2-like isoform X1 n=1 Tax=Hibiscus syriacus TaxID=106335 RepID=UPI001922184F|nr:E3 ubiquitin-protein ligase RFI2-like isoform X1 [Hibiscus syriacus]